MQSRLLGLIVRDGATQSPLPEVQAISAATLMVLQEVVDDLRHHVRCDSVAVHRAHGSSLEDGPRHHKDVAGSHVAVIRRNVAASVSTCRFSRQSVKGRMLR